jgi:hypothetical protein
MVTMDNEKMPKNAEKFYCELCDFKCSKYSNFLTHNNTRKHKIAQNDNKMVTFDNCFLPKNAEFICKCGNTYKHKSGLSRHKKVCIINENEISDKEIIMMLIKEHSELKSLIMDVVKNGTSNTNNSYNTTNTNSHNKAFNLQFFLNETCKNAMNIMEFADSIQLQISDLENVGQAGYVEGISNIIVKNLKALDVTERPIHCTDKKREVLYVKDENKWEKDEDKNKIKKAIKRVANKNMRLLPAFKQKYPDCNKSASIHSDQYNKMIVESMDTDGENENKIITNISKQVLVEKDTVATI